MILSEASRVEVVLSSSVATRCGGSAMAVGGEQSPIASKLVAAG